MTSRTRRGLRSLPVLILLAPLAIVLHMSAAQANPPAAEIAITAAPNPVEVNGFSTVTVAVGNGLVGETVTLEQKVAGLLWAPIATAPLDSDLEAQFAQRWPLAGKVHYRARVAASAAHAAGTSTILVLVVSAEMPSPPPGTFTCGGATPTIARPGGGSWECSYNDEFAGSELDTTYWSIAANGHMPEPKADPACFGTGTENVSVSDGYLHLSATVKATAAACPNSNTRTSRKFGAQVWHNSALGTQPRLFQTYGLYEIKAKLPGLHGTQPGGAGPEPRTYPTDTAAGLQETFYLWPRTDSYGFWPLSGEMDFAEFYSAAGNIAAPAVHWGLWQTTTGGWDVAACNLTNPGGDNVYTFLWAPTKLTMWVNHHPDPCLEHSYSGGPFNRPFYLTLTQAFGVDMSTAQVDADNSYTPAPGEEGLVGTTEIDYVRIWQ